MPPLTAVGVFAGPLGGMGPCLVCARAHLARRELDVHLLGLDEGDGVEDALEGVEVVGGLRDALDPLLGHLGLHALEQLPGRVQQQRGVVRPPPQRHRLHLAARL